MINAKHILATSAIISTLYIGSKLINKTKDNFFHNLKFNIPIGKIGLKIQLAQTIVSTTLEVKNNYFQNISIEGINMTVYIRNIKTNSLSELASTQPTTKKYVIQRNAMTNISGIKVDLNNFTLIKNGISNMLNYQKGAKLFKVIISGYANGVPFNTETWY